MDPFLSVVASAFPSRAGISYSKEQAKPKGCYPNRPASGTKIRPPRSTCSHLSKERCTFKVLYRLKELLRQLFRRKRKKISISALEKAFSYHKKAGFQPYSNREWVWFEHRLKHEKKGQRYAMRSIKKIETCRDDKKRALSCVALKKKRLTEGLSYSRFLPSAPA